MIPRHGRLICLAAALCLWLPFAGNLLGPTAGHSTEENRSIAGFPQWPGSAGEWVRFPRRLEAYAEDNFGFRGAMVGAYSGLRYVARSPVNDKVAFGRNGWLYYAAADIFEQSRGQTYRAGGVADFVEVVVRLHDLVAARGGRMIVAMPPNRHSVATENLPRWALRFDGPTEYDAILRLLARRGVPAIDLRPVLEAGKAVGPVYRPRNTHWTRLGALLAVNAVAAELGRGDWRIDPAGVVIGATAAHGDLAGMIGVADIAPDIDTLLDLSAYRPAQVETTSLDDFLDQPSYIVETSNGGGTVLVMGDSFSRDIMADYFAAHAARYVWTHFRWCGFDWSLIERNLPATVIVMPVERYALCGADPGLPATAAAHGATDPPERRLTAR